MFLNDYFMTKYYKYYGKEAIDYLLSFKGNQSKYVYSNDKAIESLQKRGFEFKNVGENSFLINKIKGSISSTPEFLSGDLFIMDLPSIVTGRIVSGEQILDCFSSPGGKSIVISKNNSKSRLFSLEIDAERFLSLKYNIIRSGSMNITAVNMDFLKLTKEDLGLFDSILIDVPCSGSFYKDSDWFKKRHDVDFLEKQKAQIEFFEHAYSLLKEGGILIYSTCTLEPEENHEMYDYISTKMTPLSINEEIKEKFLVDFKNYKKAVQFLPWVSNTEPFFLAKFQKN